MALLLFIIIRLDIFFFLQYYETCLTTFYELRKFPGILFSHSKTDSMLTCYYLTYIVCDLTFINNNLKMTPNRTLSESFILCIFADIMDLTCPSFVHDETSDYGSRDTSDSENVISGVSIIETPSGKIFSAHIQKKKNCIA